jgi:signal transduction histidine kinase
MRLAASGLSAYGESDGLVPSRVQAIVAGPRREMYVVVTGPRIYHFDGARFTGVRPNIGSAQSTDFFQAPLMSAGGEWWVPTDQGLYRFPRVARLQDLGTVQPTAVYGVEHGLPAAYVHSPFEDARGDVWFGVAGSDAVVRWERAAAKFHIYREHDGLSSAGPPAGFAEDRAGNLWIGFHRGAVARFRQGRFEMFRGSDGVPPGEICTLHLDAAGRLWIGARDAALAYRTAASSSEDHTAASEAELARIDDPGADRPRFFLYPPELLSGEGVRDIAEDRSGALYIGSDRGVHRLDPATGVVRRLTVADGLPSEDVEAAFVDAEDRLWFGTWRGIARLVPGQAAAVPTPAVRIGQLQVRGVAWPVADLGEREISGLEFEPDQNQLEIGYFAIAFAGGPPRFQYRLEGADAVWGPPTQDRRVTYASLSPGQYRFLVRSITADGAVTQPAVISFVIRRPVWQRPWFLTVVSTAALLLVSVAHRARVARLLAVERMRTRIATDLHDDIGASLSQIAILSEVIRHRHSRDRELGEALGRIATTSREAVEAMSDIVWAINPRRDSLVELVQRMRRFASDVLAARGIEFTFQAPADAVSLSADVRRHVFLVFKESINNLARHSGAAHAAIVLSLHGGRLTLQVIDDGRGFDSTATHAGHGLASMRARAEAIGGTLEISAKTGTGTRLRLEVPLV